MEKGLGPYKLMTVNSAPERAKILIGRVVEDLKDRYEIHYVVNASSKFIPPILHSPIPLLPYPLQKNIKTNCIQKNSRMSQL